MASVGVERHGFWFTRHLPRGGELEERSAFVDLIEHRGVEHGRAQLTVTGGLRPEEPAAIAGNLVIPHVCVALGREGIVPGEARKDNRHIFEPQPMGLSNIRSEPFFDKPVKAFRVMVAPDGPWAEYVE